MYEEHAISSTGCHQYSRWPLAEIKDKWKARCRDTDVRHKRDCFNPEQRQITHKAQSIENDFIKCFNHEDTEDHMCQSKRIHV